MRRRVHGIRRRLADALLRAGAPESFQVVRNHKGLFSRLPLTPVQMHRLRLDHGVYGAADGRINVAGVTPAGVDRVAGAVAAVARRA